MSDDAAFAELASGFEEALAEMNDSTAPRLISYLHNLTVQVLALRRDVERLRTGTWR